MRNVYLKPYSRIEYENFPYEALFRINKSDFDNLDYDGTLSEFAFIGCKFKKLVIDNIDNVSFHAINISFIDCYIDRLEVENISSDNVSFYFGSSVVSGRIKSDNIDNVTVNNVIVQNGLFLLGEFNINVSYTEENIFALRWKRLLNELHVKDLDQFLKIEQRYYFENPKSLIFYAREANAGKPGLVKDSFRYSLESKYRFQLSDSQKANIDIGISLSYNKKVEKSRIKISSSALKVLTIEGEQNGAMNIEKCKIQNLYIRDFSTKGDAVFYDIKPIDANAVNKIGINESNLDNGWFDNIDFNKYKPLSFYRTRFGKVRFSSCTFPANYKSFENFSTLKNVHYPDEKSDNNYKDQYEIFLQLKNALEANGNFYEAQKLQAISNEALKKINDVPRWDKAILWTNSISNNHGLSIKRALFGFLISTIALYIGYLSTLGLMFNNNGFDSSLIGYYFSFIDPTHKIEFLVDKEEFNVGSLAFDFIGKLVSGFYIFQFVAAFRKYGKSK